MNALPDPLVPPDVDLKSYGYMPLEFRRLFASDTWILGNPEERCAALALWCESWHQVPAGSLPDDPKVLADLSRTGPRWKRLSNHAMRGWVKCSDGRLYHPVVCQKALEAWGAKRTASDKGKLGAHKRWGSSGSAPATGDLWQGHSNRIEGKGIEGKDGITPQPPFMLPGWVPKEAWSAFEEMRIKTKKPMTDRARDLIVAELVKISGPAGQNAGAILDQSTRNNWQDVYPLRQQRGPGGAAVDERNRTTATNWAAKGQS